MIRYYRLARVACLTLCALLTAQSSFADYIGGIGTSTGEILRIADNGTTLPTSFVANVPQSIKNQTETIVESMTITPDLKKAYSFTNTLGFANYVLAWDTNTSQFRQTDTFSPTGVGDDYVNNARMPVIVGNEIFVTSFIGQNFSGNRQVKRYSLTSHSLLETIDPLVPQAVDDIALNSSGSSLYVAGTSGIYRYTKSAGVYENGLATLLIPGVDGNIAFGPDSRLYVRNFANGDIQRYTTSGAFIDTFISHNDYPNLNTIQFGVDGNLHAYQFTRGPSQIRKFDPTTGSLLSSTPAPFNGDSRITYIPAPEPSGLTLVAIGLAFAASHRRANRR
jgi:hypothetical protein